MTDTAVIARVRKLIAEFRSDADAAKQAGRRYEGVGAIASAQECYGQMYGFDRSAEKLEAVLASAAESRTTELDTDMQAVAMIEWARLIRSTRHRSILLAVANDLEGTARAMMRDSRVSPTPGDPIEGS